MSDKEIPNEEKNSKWKILLVEDNAFNQVANSCFLEDMGYTFDLAKDGEQALKLYQENHYHMIILDIGLPDINGIEVCKKIRTKEIEAAKHTPIIVLTAFGEFIEDECWDAGIDDFVVKPFLFEDMETTIQHWLPKE